MSTTFQTPTFADLLATVATEPGALEQAFSRFHNYSIGNQLLAWAQCMQRGIELGPIATYKAWQDLGRQVRKGSKAISLLMPVPCARTEKDDATGAETTVTFTRFVTRARWFVLSQTDGEAYEAPAAPTWDGARALAALDVEQVPFDMLNGNVQGYAIARKVAVSPVAERPLATLLHELAHVVLGHTSQDGTRLEDGAVIDRAEREVEAESVAFLVLASLGESGLEYCRGYVQHYLRGNTIEERTAQRIFKAADTILRAGRVEAAETEQDSIAA